MQLDDRLKAIDRRLHAGRKVAISGGEHHRHPLHVVQVKNCDFLQLFKWPEIELKTGPNLGMIQVAVFHVAFGIKD